MLALLNESNESAYPKSLIACLSRLTCAYSFKARSPHSSTSLANSSLRSASPSSSVDSINSAYGRKHNDLISPQLTLSPPATLNKLETPQLFSDRQLDLFSSAPLLHKLSAKESTNHQLSVSDSGGSKISLINCIEESTISGPSCGQNFNNSSTPQGEDHLPDNSFNPLSESTFQLRVSTFSFLVLLVCIFFKNVDVSLRQLFTSM
ncbi:unnamed protein product [Protopolystoma xenopodis]|uniref:Uncharacterized protein n=1 Tax=Protopolystoma xenopodis TaxID=117903 RepID=A0A448XJM1_9PLAT|nr:unnamed protein product [Protopolystoma xenopodis]